MGFGDIFNSSLVDYSSDMSVQDTKYAIKNWIKLHARTRKNRIIGYTITDDLKININGDCVIIKTKDEKNISEFPDYINFNICKGSFYCYKLGLTTLRGCPKTVYGDFDCSHNKLKDLVGGPMTLEKKYSKSIVKGLKEHSRRFSKCNEYKNIEYNCSNNYIISFEGRPKNTKNCKLKCNNNPFFIKIMEDAVGKFDNGYQIV